MHDSNNGLILFYHFKYYNHSTKAICARIYNQYEAKGMPSNCIKGTLISYKMDKINIIESTLI